MRGPDGTMAVSALASVLNAAVRLHYRVVPKPLYRYTTPVTTHENVVGARRSHLRQCQSGVPAHRRGWDFNWKGWAAAKATAGSPGCAGDREGPMDQLSRAREESARSSRHADGTVDVSVLKVKPSGALFEEYELTKKAYPTEVKEASPDKVSRLAAAVAASKQQELQNVKGRYEVGIVRSAAAGGTQQQAGV